MSTVGSELFRSTAICIFGNMDRWQGSGTETDMHAHMHICRGPTLNLLKVLPVGVKERGRARERAV